MKPKILLAIINNYTMVPTSFMVSLLELYSYTKNSGVDVHIQTFSAITCDYMRNLACRFANEQKYTHIFMVDVDMIYPKGSIVELLKHDKDFVVGTARQRVPPYLPTQFKEFKDDKFMSEDNRLYFKEETKLTKVGSTGVVGALIKTEVFNILKHPYFVLEYKNSGAVTGSDTYFCKLLVENKIDLWCDPNVNYGHFVNCFVDKDGVKSFNG